MNPKVSFILSAFDRPQSLRCVVAALQVQTEPAIEVLIADNAADEFISIAHRKIIVELCDSRFAYYNPRTRTCYESSKMLAHATKSPWLCFPHDDGYYVPGFTERMLKCADATQAQFIYCDMIYDPRMTGEYSVIPTSPKLGCIDKGGFLINRELFLSVDWPASDGDRCRDGLLVEELVRLGVVMAKAPGVMWIHN